MKIKYLGHSCFVLTESTGTTVVTDPYNRIGIKMPKVQADAVTVSHHHYDHDFVKGVSKKGEKLTVINKEGEYELSGVGIKGIKSYHDEVQGEKRGENVIFKFRMDGLHICHMGDIGEECSAELLEMLLPVNILLIPVGGTYTIDAEQAKEYVDRLMPEIVIPMHYKAKGIQMDIDKPDEFIDLCDSEEIEECESGELEFFRDDLSDDTTKVILMERAE